MLPAQNPAKNSQGLHPTEPACQPVFIFTKCVGHVSTETKATLGTGQGHFTGTLGAVWLPLWRKARPQTSGEAP